jgi:hypothetical protein
MGIKIKLVALIIGIIFAFFIFRFIKRNSFRPSYAVLWLSICFLLVSIPIFETFYKWIASNIIGIDDARHIIYIGLIGFLLIFNFYLTIMITKMSDRIHELISFVAVLENKISKHKDMELSRKVDPNGMNTLKVLEHDS